MDEIQIDCDGITLDVEYDYEDADHSVGLPASIQIHSIKHQGVDLYEIISDKVIESIGQEIMDGY